MTTFIITLLVFALVLALWLLVSSWDENRSKAPAAAWARLASIRPVISAGATHSVATRKRAMVTWARQVPANTIPPTSPEDTPE